MLRTRVVGLGSGQGDDQAGWRLVEMLRSQLPPGTEAVALGEPSRLLDHLDGCGKLVLVDAGRSGRLPGTITRLAWPDPALETRAGPSSHGLGVGAVLSLAAHLDRLPPAVVLFAVEARTCEAGGGLSAVVARALPDLCRLVVEEVTRGA
jgi:hydrogenase maturation protease